MTMPSEPEAIAFVLAAADRYGYGNLISRLKVEWAYKLTNEYAMPRDLAEQAADTFSDRKAWFEAAKHAGHWNGVCEGLAVVLGLPAGMGGHEFAQAVIAKFDAARQQLAAAEQRAAEAEDVGRRMLAALMKVDGPLLTKRYVEPVQWAETVVAALAAAEGDAARLRRAAQTEIDELKRIATTECRDCDRADQGDKSVTAAYMDEYDGEFYHKRLTEGITSCDANDIWLAINGLEQALARGQAAALAAPDGATGGA